MDRVEDMPWRYRLLREDLRKMEPRRKYAIPVDNFVARYWRGNGKKSVREMISAVKRAARAVGEKVEVSYGNGKIYIRIYQCCACGR